MFLDLSALRSRSHHCGEVEVGVGAMFFSREPKLKNEYQIFPDVFFQHFFPENPKFQLEVVPKEICSTKSGPVLGIYIYRYKFYIQ